MRATMALEQMEWNRCESECRSRSTYVQWCIRIVRDSHSDSRTEHTAPKNKKMPFCDYYFIVFARIRYWRRTSSFCNFIRKYISSDQSAWIALKHFLPSTNIPIFVLANMASIPGFIFAFGRTTSIWPLAHGHWDFWHFNGFHSICCNANPVQAIAKSQHRIIMKKSAIQEVNTVLGRFAFCSSSTFAYFIWFTFRFGRSFFRLRFYCAARLFTDHFFNWSFVFAVSCWKTLRQSHKCVRRVGMYIRSTSTPHTCVVCCCCTAPFKGNMAICCLAALAFSLSFVEWICICSLFVSICDLI